MYADEGIGGMPRYFPLRRTEPQPLGRRHTSPYLPDDWSSPLLLRSSAAS
jgi:hypothetical protein